MSWRPENVQPGGVDGDDGLDVLEEVDLGVGTRAGGCLDGQEEGLVSRNFSENTTNAC